MDLILTVVVFAFLIETVVEILKPLLYKLDGVSDIIGIEMAYLASLVQAVAGAVVFDVNALEIFGITGSGMIGRVLTGLIASGGSNYVHNKLRHVSEVTIEETFEDEPEE